MKKNFILVTVLSSIIIPVLSFAQVRTDYIDNLISSGLRITSSLVILLISVSVVWFIWNVIKYTMSAEPADKDKAKDQMIRGIIAITVSVSIWGLVAILQNMFNTGGKSAPTSTELQNMIPRSF